MLFAEALRASMFGVFRYHGRSDRLEQWTFSFLTAILVAVAMLFSHLGVRFEDHLLLTLLAAILWLVLAHVALFVRRLHDNGRSGLYMLIPAAAITVVIVGWLGQNGYVHFYRSFLIDYGHWIIDAGRVCCSMSGTFLLWIFLSEGDEDENDFGYPP